MYLTTDHRHPMNQKRDVEHDKPIPSHVALPVEALPLPPKLETPACPICKGTAHVKPLGSDFHCTAIHSDPRGTVGFKLNPPGHPYKWHWWCQERKP